MRDTFVTDDMRPAVRSFNINCARGSAKNGYEYECHSQQHTTDHNRTPLSKTPFKHQPREPTTGRSQHQKTTPYAYVTQIYANMLYICILQEPIRNFATEIYLCLWKSTDILYYTMRCIWTSLLCTHLLCVVETWSQCHPDQHFTSTNHAIYIVTVARICDICVASIHIMSRCSHVLTVRSRRQRRVRKWGAQNCWSVFLCVPLASQMNSQHPSIVIVWQTLTGQSILSASFLGINVEG